VDGLGVPYHSVVYLKELRKHCTELVYLHSNPLNNKDKLFFKENTIKAIHTANNGFDFGLWYKAMQQIDLLSFDRIYLVNDSCILFTPLDNFVRWSLTDKADFQGMTYSEAVAPHLQSYFLVINKSAIKAVKDYFANHQIIENLTHVITTYEIGLSTYLVSLGFNISAFVDNNGYKGEFAPYYKCVDYHLSKGIPMIKKKIIFSSYRKDELFTLARMNFNVSTNYYINKIKIYNRNLIIDLNKLEGDLQGLGVFQMLNYQMARLAICFLHLFYKRKKRND